MGTAAFSWGVSRYYALLLLHNSDDDHSCVRSAASWDENQQVYGGRNEVTGGYSLCFSKNGRIAVMVHPYALSRTSGIESLCFDFTTASVLPKFFAERCKLWESYLRNFHLIVADIQCNSMYYIKNTANSSLEYHEVTPGAYILFECGLNGMRRNDPTNAKSEALMVQFENMLAKYQDQHLDGYQIAETIMTNPTRADEDDVLSSVFVDTVGYGTVCTSSIMVENFIVELNMWRLSFFERYREENGNWSEHHENFSIASDYIPTWQREMLEEEKKMKEAAEASTKAAEYVASASTGEAVPQEMSVNLVAGNPMDALQQS